MVTMPFLLVADQRVPLPGRGRVGLRGTSIGPAPSASQQWLVASVRGDRPLEPDLVRFVGMGHLRARETMDGYFFTLIGPVPTGLLLAAWPEGVPVAKAEVRVGPGDMPGVSTPCAVKLFGPSGSQVGVLCPDGSTSVLLVPGNDDHTLYNFLSHVERVVTRSGVEIPSSRFRTVKHPTAHRYTLHTPPGPSLSWRVPPGARSVRQMYDTPVAPP